ncbi:MAG TPA: FkbM family methyltransferase [Solirubrobacterales bacterium]|nr:FkbM family methyltransferase [Solirubrobacterales bacterium]
MINSPPLYLAARRWFGVGRYLARRPHDSDFRYFGRFGSAGGLFLDVGANTGSSALSYRVFDRSSRIFSLEPNPMLGPDLRLVRRVIGRDFSYRFEAAGAGPGELTLFVPVYRGLPLTGEASLSAEEARSNWTAEQLGIAPAEIELEEVAVKVRAIDEHRLSPHAVKIDVEGAEVAVLEGMAATLERSRPVLLVETADPAPAMALLSPLGYEACVYRAGSDEVEPYVGGVTANALFVPAG